MPKKVAVVLGVIFGLEDGARQKLIKQKQDSSMVTDRLPYESSSGRLGFPPSRECSVRHCGINMTFHAALNLALLSVQSRQVRTMNSSTLLVWETRNGYNTECSEAYQVSVTIKRSKPRVRQG